MGFFLLHYAPLYKKHLHKLVSSWQSGKLHISMDAQCFRSDPKARYSLHQAGDLRCSNEIRKVAEGVA